MFYDDFIKRYAGKATDYDGAYKAQCVDLIKAYLHDGYQEWSCAAYCCDILLHFT